MIGHLNLCEVHMLKKINHFLKRDKDITYYDEFNYIYITIKETLKILLEYKIKKC